MLTIRAEQMKAFRERRTASFRQNLQRYLSELQAVRAMGWSAERIESETEAAMRYASEFHLKREVDVARLAEIFCKRLEGFTGRPVDPDGLNILYAYGEEAEGKLRRFEEYLDGKSGALQGERDGVLRQ